MFPLFLYAPSTLRLIAAQRKASIKRRLGLCVPWHAKIRWNVELNIRASTYTPYNLFSDVTPSSNPDVNALKITEFKLSPHMQFLYCVKRLPRGVTLDTCYGKRRGSVLFDGPVNIPALYEWSKHDESWNELPWMSLTPSEFISLRGGIRAARGHTIVAGLGLGHQLIEISKKKSVKKVTLVERSQELVDWLMPRIRPLLGPATLDVIVDDATAVVPKLTADVACIDIFDSYGGNEFPRCPDVGRVWIWGTQYVKDSLWD
jgi:hypothetical protein